MKQLLEFLGIVATLGVLSYVMSIIVVVFATIINIL